MKCLIIDNYDSFTWNLVHYAAEAFGVEPLVVYNDEYTWEELKASGNFDCIIVSPGPGNAVNEKDFNVSRQAVMQTDIPVLGVCLGMQGIAYYHGAGIVHAPVPYHGRSSLVKHTGDALFANIPAEFSVTRYHSLMVGPNDIPESISITAQTDSGIIMGLRHKSLPKWGVQFHPESINTEYGKQIIHNFRDLAHRHVNRSPGKLCEDSVKRSFETQKELSSSHDHRVLVSRKIVPDCDSESVFTELFGEAENSFWLDSVVPDNDLSSFSFMGQASTNNVLSYSLSDDTDKFERGHEFLQQLDSDLEQVVIEGGDDLPFQFRGGWIGYFTYEMKAVFGADNVHHNHIPDALWLHADRFIAFDHVSGAVWVISISSCDEIDTAQQWVDAHCEKILDIDKGAEGTTSGLGLDELTVYMDRGYEEYIAAIRHCQDAIKNGESYEVCLTNNFHIDAKVDPLSLYRHLRKTNPAPFGAFIKNATTAILSSSPELFLEVDSQGGIKTKPMKGTISRSRDPQQDRVRAQTLAQSCKDRAENLMIVDLMRNDLARVSDIGSVAVPVLMDVETFATVHQMVSTVEAQLKSGSTLIDLVRATFPGGSISGAPKLRTMEIIDQLERRARGVYCGSIGYLGYNRVACLNIAIRTLCCSDEGITYGAGGAITYLSESDNEFEEILVKSAALLGPVWGFMSDADPAFSYELDGNKMRISGKADTLLFGGS